jgi:DNA-binding XRE family transcriptional regulator
VKSFSHYSPEMAKSRIDEYEEAKRILYQYKVLVATLNDEQRELLKDYYIPRKIAPWDKHYLFKEIYINWLEIVFPNGDDLLKRLDKVKTATIIKQLRIQSGYNKEEVSGLIGISSASLRHYEEGKILVPLDVLFLMFQIYGVTIEKLSLLHENSKK